MLDCNNNEVKKGDRVRIIKICSVNVHTLPEDEKYLVESMISNIFKVEDIENGYVIVSKKIEIEEGKWLIQSLNLSPDEIQLEQG